MTKKKEETLPPEASEAKPAHKHPVLMQAPHDPEEDEEPGFCCGDPSHHPR